MEASARETGAFSRSRHIRCAGDLLRLVLVYCTQGLSFRSVSAWSKETGLTQVSDTDLIKRMRRTPEWLSHLLHQQLDKHLDMPPSNGGKGGGRIHLVDSTLIQRSGVQQSDWRIHTSWDLCQQKIIHLSLTEGSVAESLSLHPVAPGDLVIGNRGYARHRNIVDVAQRGGQVLLRMHWKSLRLESLSGKRIQLESLSFPGEVMEIPVRILPNPSEHLPSIEGRLIIVRQSEEATQKALKRLKRRSVKRGNRLQEKTLDSTHYLFLFTTTPPEMLSAQGAAELYRF